MEGFKRMILKELSAGRSTVARRSRGTLKMFSLSVQPMEALRSGRVNTLLNWDLGTV